jgi:hypothetical protein
MPLRANQLEQALRTTGVNLDALGIEVVVRLYLVGGSAGLLSGLLPAARTTGDVDVSAVEPDDCWDAVRRAAARAAKELHLPETWLNDKCRIYGWSLPLGWKGRCHRIDRFGPLEVWAIDRQDFIAAKVVSAPRRPQDLEDLRAAGPTPEELLFAEENIDRIEREHLDPDASFEDARAILQALRGEA